MAEGWGRSGGSHFRNDASFTVCNFSPQHVVRITSWITDQTGRADNIYRPQVRILLPDKEGRASDMVPGCLSLFWPFRSNGQLSLSGCSTLEHDRYLVSESHWGREEDLRAAVNSAHFSYWKLMETETAHIMRYSGRAPGFLTSSSLPSAAKCTECTEPC